MERFVYIGTVGLRWICHDELLLRTRYVGDELARYNDKRRVRDHPEMRPHAHPLHLPMPQQGLKTFDLAEIAPRLNSLDRVLELDCRRHITNEHRAGPQCSRRHRERAPRLC